MADKYRSFDELAASEDATAYRIFARDTGSPIVIVAPHGGLIEPGTSEVASSIAGEDLSLYLFEGRKIIRNVDLHITSSRFDESGGIQLMERAQTVLTVHGAAGDEEVVYVGGRDETLCDTIVTSVRERGYAADRHGNPDLQGLNARNICNRGRRGVGVQLELSRGLRRRLFASLSRTGLGAPTKHLAALAAAIRVAI